MQAKWTSQFNEKNTKQRDFYISYNKSIKIDFMNKRGSIRYGQCPNLDVNVRTIISINKVTPLPICDKVRRLTSYLIIFIRYKGERFQCKINCVKDVLMLRIYFQL